MEARARYRRLFAYGECTRAVLNALRDAPEPMTTADLVERVALDFGSRPKRRTSRAMLLARVRAALAKLGKRGL